MATQFGTYNPDGSVETWPDVDIRGAVYSRPATTVNVGHGKFVVVPPLFDDTAALDAARADAAPKAKKGE